MEPDTNTHLKGELQLIGVTYCGHFCGGSGVVGSGEFYRCRCFEFAECKQRLTARCAVT
jgi:hypothetical protein